MTAFTLDIRQTTLFQRELTADENAIFGTILFSRKKRYRIEEISLISFHTRSYYHYLYYQNKYAPGSPHILMMYIIILHDAFVTNFRHK